MRCRLALVALLTALVVACSCSSSEDTDAEPAAGPQVIVVHGLGRTSFSMSFLASRLERAGYEVFNYGYPSTAETMEELVARLDAEVKLRCGDDARRVHFVTHSMGGILVRSYLDQQPREHLGRVVMLSPPSRGSEIIDAFGDSPMLGWMLGPAGSKLGTAPDDIPAGLGPARFSLGVITGNRSLNYFASKLIPGPDDGKVGVDRARVEGAADFLVVPATHTFIMNRRDVADQTIHFLRHGGFSREPR